MITCLNGENSLTLQNPTISLYLILGRKNYHSFKKRWYCDVYDLIKLFLLFKSSF